jgi:hypothetical protein
MSDPITKLHYTANGNFSGSTYLPGADGFNLADVSSPDQLSGLPSGVQGLVYLGTTDGATASFKATIDSFKGVPNLFGFYVADEPSGSVPAANLMAEADYIHATLPGAKAFMVEQNLSDNTSPVYVFSPANTHMDLFGLDPYPVQTNVPNNLDYGIIPLAVTAAEAAGVPLSSIVPVYQAFGGGGYSTYFMPTAAQEQTILSTWGSVVPNPAFDYAYSWGSQSGDKSLGGSPELQAIFAAHNGGGTSPSPPPPPPISPPPPPPISPPPPPPGPPPPPPPGPPSPPPPPPPPDHHHTHHGWEHEYHHEEVADDDGALGQELAYLSQGFRSPPGQDLGASNSPASAPAGGPSLAAVLSMALSQEGASTATGGSTEFANVAQYVHAIHDQVLNYDHVWG